MEKVALMLDLVGRENGDRQRFDDATGHIHVNHFFELLPSLNP